MAPLTAAFGLGGATPHDDLGQWFRTEEHHTGQGRIYDWSPIDGVGTAVVGTGDDGRGDGARGEVRRVWVHFTAVRGDGWEQKDLPIGMPVEIDYTAQERDGYHWVAKTCTVTTA